MRYTKTTWPELLGVRATLAATQIAHDRPDVAVEVLPPGSPLTPDYNAKRVQLYIDARGIVFQTPHIS